MLLCDELMVPSLPQNDPNGTARHAALEEQRQHYQYDPTKLPGVAMVQQVSDQEQSFGKFKWIQDAVSLLLRVSTNQRLQEINDRGVQLCSAVRLLSAIWLYNLLNDPSKANFLQRLLARIQFFIQRRFQPKTRETATEKIEVELKADTEFVAKSVTELAKIVSAPTQHVTDLQTASSEPLGDSLKDYQAYFKPYDDLFQLIYLPCIRHAFDQDSAFAAQRVAGANPLVIAQITTLPDKFPVTETQYKAVMGDQDSLAKAGPAGRLYLADYDVLEGVKTGKVADAQKYLWAPLALFAVPAGDSGVRSLVLVAIQCSQKPDGPIFTPPPPGTPQAKKWSWLMAKTIVQIADGNYHELISHLGRTHLLIEAFILATYQQLAPNHPINVLLMPHFEGTLFINELALRGLINPGGTVDKVLGGTLEESLRISAQGVKGYPFSFNQSMIPKTFASRGVDNPEQLPDYPYRDDALLVWDAIHQWVSAYVQVYYDSDQAVCQDTELQNWLADLLDPKKGGLSDVGESSPDQAIPGIYTLGYLIDAVTLLIFTGSAQHAAVNFPQSALMTYAPNMPLAGYRPAPDTSATVQDYLDLLPTIDQAEIQMNMTYPLGSLYYTRLGEYGDSYFEDPRVKAPLQAFQKRLRDIEIEIDDRNAVRPTTYEYLHPANIPQSTNI